jgi:hypothetical protein
MIGRRRSVDQGQGLLDQDLAGHLAQGSPRHIHIRREAHEIDLGQDLAERVIGQAEEETMLPGHLHQMTDEGVRPGQPLFLFLRASVRDTEAGWSEAASVDPTEARKNMADDSVINRRGRSLRANFFAPLSRTEWRRAEEGGDRRL